MITSALLTAVSVVLGRFASIPVNLMGIFALNFGFGLAPVILSGLLFGPTWGFLTGFLADLIGALAFPKGAYVPLFSLTYALAGFTPAALAAGLPGLKKWIRNPIMPTDAAMDTACGSYLRLLVCVGISQILFSVGLNSLFISMLYGRSFLALLPARLLAQVVLIPLFAFICRYLCRLYRRSFGKN